MEGRLVYEETIGLVTAAIYCYKNEYRLYLLGDRLASFLGSAPSLADCQEEIRCLKRLDNAIGADLAGQINPAEPLSQ